MTDPAVAQQRRLDTIRATLLRDLDRIWADLFDDSDPVASLNRVGPLVAARIDVGQSQALTVAVIAADRILADAFGQAALTVWAPPELYVGVDRYGRSIPTMLAGAPTAYTRRVASGMDPSAALSAEQTFQRRIAGTEPHRIGRQIPIDLADPTSGITHPQVDRWARRAHPGACDFCVMLAGRGFAYTSKQAAQQATDGARYHDNCGCTVEAGPVGTRDTTAEAHYQAWKDNPARGKEPRGSTGLPAGSGGAANGPEPVRGAGGGGGRKPPVVGSSADGGFPWDNPQHRAAHEQVRRELERRRTSPVGIGDLDDALRELERVRQQLDVRGLIDLTFKEFDADEMVIARLLASEGHNVTGLVESEVPGVKTADAAVGAIRTEFKTVRGSGRVLRDRLDEAGKKSPSGVVRIVARSPISRSAAEQAGWTALKRWPNLRSVRIVKDRAFDMTLP